MKLCIGGDIYFIPKFHILETGTVKLSIETGLKEQKAHPVARKQKQTNREKRLNEKVLRLSLFRFLGEVFYLSSYLLHASFQTFLISRLQSRLPLLREYTQLAKNLHRVPYKHPFYHHFVAKIPEGPKSSRKSKEFSPIVNSP
jgi:hypothetical protein